MCQILILTNTFKVKNQKKLCNVIAEHLQSTQLDGFGYSILGKEGIFGERTTRGTFSSRIGLTDLEVGSPIVEPTYNIFGKVAQSFGAGIFHGRTSTNSLGLINTHPINKHDWSLIHNGVVTDLGPDYPKLTSNDSEDMLHHLVNGGIPSIEKNISGYYAIGAIDPKGNLHVIKDSTAQLYVAFNKTLDCLVFGTTEDLITEVARGLKWSIGPIDKVKNNIYLIFDKKGNHVSTQDIKPLGYSNLESKYASKSLGFKIGDLETASLIGYEPQYESESIDLYREELERLDVGYTFFDWNNRPLSLEEFRLLDEVSKMDCKVVRPDGTIVDPDDYYTERIA